MSKKNISIIGGGPSALIFAAIINTNKFNVTIYEKGNNVGRKFLVAGDGGLNLTHSEIPEEFIVKYTPTKFIKPYFQKFNNYNLINWINDIGIETFVGSSKRVFPLKVIKPITVLNCIIDKIKANDVTINTLHEWMGWDHNNLVFKTPLGEKQVETDFTIFALGGASWSVTGSDGKWIEKFAEKGIKTVPFQASNCAFQINWSESFINENEGNFLKNISISCGSLTKKGELTITKLGLEGGAIYALSHKIRSQINSLKEATVFIDFKPIITQQAIIRKLSNETKSIADILRFDLNLTPTQIALIKEYTSKEEYNNIEFIAEIIKNFPLKIIGTAPIDEAISTVGGIALNEVAENLELIKMSHSFCMGEMLDWDAPTGGYLLQANFSMGFYLADYFNGLP
ncbi:MAG: TIGR03862 family flavoprotein [Bacteroidota bacterium]|jgi:uncharacterized flavoprotein (TIGR03862 family)